MNLNLSILPGRYAICRLSPNVPMPDWAPPDDFLSVTWTADELSIVCSETAVREGVKCDRGWRCFKVAGPLDLSLTGVLASLANPLAKARINIFAISTFDTDYLLVQGENLQRAAEVLIQSGHHVKDLS